MALKEQIQAVHRLIDRSKLLKDEDKSELKSYVETLKENELKQVQAYLEKENDVILSAFEKGISSLPEEGPMSNLFKELDDFFLTTKKVFLGAEEEDTRKEEGANIEQLLKNL